MATNSYTYEEKLGITESGSAPKEVIENVSSAANIYQRLREQNLKRFYVYGRIQGMFDGNPPYAKGELLRNGLATNSNVNFRLADSILRENLVTFHNLFNDVENLVEFRTTFAGQDAGQNAKLGKILSGEFDAVIRSWDDFYPLMQYHQSEYLKYGLNTIHWPHEKDWRFSVLDTWKLLVPEDSRVTTGALSTVCILHTMTAQELWEIHENSKSDLWDKKEIVWLLFMLSNTCQSKFEKFTENSCAAWQNMIRNNSISLEQEFNDDINLVSLYVKEWDGGISRYIFHPVLWNQEPLYKGKGIYKEMREAFLIFPFTPGEIYIHANKGLGHDIFGKVEVITKMDNSLVDATARASTVLVSTRAGRGKDMKQIKFVHGGFVDIGEAQFQQNLMGSNLNANIASIQHFQGKLQSDSMRTGLSSLPGNSKKENAEMRRLATREARIAKNSIAYYYLYLDRLFQEIVRKMLKATPKDPGFEYVETWIKNCVREGVPLEFFAATLQEANIGLNGLPIFLEVEATRANGAGSQQAYQEETEGLMQILPVLGERGRNNVIEDRVASLVGYRNIARYRPPEDAANAPTAEDTIASIENNQLEQGEVVIVSPDNNHAVHAIAHARRMQQVAQAFREGTYAREEGPSDDPETRLDPSLQEADRAFQALGPHFTRHLLYLAQDPTRKALVDDLRSQWAVLANFGDYLANNAQEQREAEEKRLEKKALEMQQANAIGGPNDPQMVKIQKEHERKMIKLQADIQKGRTRDQLKYILARQQLSDDNQIDQLKAINEIAIKKAKELGDKSGGDSSLF